MTEPLKVALVGCGRILKKHLEVVKTLDNLELVGVCDIDPERAKAASEIAGVPAYADGVEMARELKPDIASVLVDSGSHARVARALVPYVGNLVVEKPMALTLDDADQMIEDCQHQGVGLFVVKQNRYNRAIVKVRRALESGRFGKLVLGTARVRWSRSQAYYDQDDWRGTWKWDGGVFANQASHHIDLLLWMMGPVESVQCYTATRLVDIETEDTGVAVMRFTSGALGIVEATTATRPKDLEGSISLLGERGTAIVGGFAANEITTWQFADQSPEDDDIDEWRENPPNVYGFGHLEFYRDVVDCILTGRRAMLDGLEARKSLELIIALYEAAENRREVRVRYVPRDVSLGHDS